ncbi:MAG: coproporphyrinogen III oxidase [Cyanobacterium sp. T60_A2020_053]|nr:coproporphyrinogen III oxidase [Cyanobacterium sp. T60_A2020_053]
MSISAVYIHIPFCRRRCFYCDFPVTVLGDSAGSKYSNWQKEYVSFLCEEIAVTAENNSAIIETIFFGGGTPSLLHLQGLQEIFTTIHNCFNVSKNAEISLEIDPATFNLEQLQEYKKLGINRLSLGVQSFQDNLLANCGRTHSLNDIYQGVNYIHEVGFDNWSLDLISGLPQQTLSDWRESVRRALDLQPRHISCYDLVLESGTVFGKKYQAGDKPLPPDDVSAQMYCIASETLRENGYQHYEICNYASQGYESRHNLTYWRNQPYYGFGMGAASYVSNKRYTRPRTRQEYFDFVRQLQQNQGYMEVDTTEETDQLLETLMLGLRLQEGVNLADIEVKFGQNIVSRILHCLQPYIKDNWVIFSESNSNLKLTDPDGFLYSNTVLSSLFVEF